MSDLKPCPFCGEVPSIMSVGMAGQPRWQHPVNDTCPIAGHYLGGWDFPKQWNTRALPAVQPVTVQEAARVLLIAESLEAWAQCARDGRPIDPSVVGLMEMARTLRALAEGGA